MLIDLTRSQLMALRDLVLEHVTRCPNPTEVYINLTGDDGTVVDTTPEELLQVLMQEAALEMLPPGTPDPRD